MGNIIILTKKELANFFNSSLAFIFLVIFLLLTNWLFFQNFFLLDQASLRGYFSLLPTLFLLLAPALTMRLWAEERRSRTIELLLTLPLKDSEVVFAKFLASLAILAVTLLLSLNLPLLAAALGNLDWGPVFAGYLGALLLGGSYLSIGLFTSSLTKNQLAAFIGGISLCFLLFVVGEPIFLSPWPTPLKSLFALLSTGRHFANLVRGVLDSRDIIFYLSLTTFFLVLNVKSLEAQR